MGEEKKDDDRIRVFHIHPLPKPGVGDEAG
jgi:hypothetical protein